AKHTRGQDTIHVLQPLVVNLEYGSQLIYSGLWMTWNDLHVAKLP
ncbi:hypothetical protein A2U01_0060041, partial [Trifolium medium]|nr:hypothetical protein [Trifolium medium]